MPRLSQEEVEHLEKMRVMREVMTSRRRRVTEQDFAASGLSTSKARSLMIECNLTWGGGSWEIRNGQVVYEMR